jgi:osmotically-inducible protein OsmY
MKSDASIQQDVIDQIKSNPLLTASEIGVAVKDGIVTLSGQVNTCLKKAEAEKEAKKVAGVKAIAEDIAVGISPRHQKTDAEIAEAVLLALKWHTSIPQEKVIVKVEDGFVTLEGEVDWAFQREAARAAVVSLIGVRSVFNNIKLRPRVTPVNVQQKINAAFHRMATVDASKIQVAVEGNQVVLTGQVRSLAEREEAGKAAWSAPGIQEVKNELELGRVAEP